MRATSLLARLHGFAPLTDDVPCFYCGAPADRPLTLSNTFADWADVAAPTSRALCDGCWLSLDEKLVMTGRDKPQKRRNYSWLITDNAAVPFGKGDVPAIRGICLDPPDPPWALSIAVSGQKHLLWRTPVNRQERPCAVMLETERVVYSPDQLKALIDRATLISGAIGKPALADPLDARLYNRLVDAVGEDRAESAAQWYDSTGPLHRLAAFLCPAKKEAALELTHH